jgi:hypothetical protein
MISCRDCWPWTKPGYITMTRRQRNNQWSEDIVAHLASNKFRVQNSTGTFLASNFGDQDGILLINYLPKGHTINAEYYLSLLLQLKDILKENVSESSQSVSCSWRVMPRLTGHLQPRKSWPPGLASSWSPTLFSGSGPVGLPPFLWTKKHWKFAIFRPTRRSLLPRRLGSTDKFWVFWAACKSYSNGLSRVKRFVGSMWNNSFACFLDGWAKVLWAPARIRAQHCCNCEWNLFRDCCATSVYFFSHSTTIATQMEDMNKLVSSVI